MFEGVRSLGLIAAGKRVRYIHAMRRLTTVEDSEMALTWWVNFNL